jgi:tetratricopeptide (TPR) repeat protein
MSLLLEALKKAERAKEEAQRSARGQPEIAELAPLPEQPVVTRGQLPDIRQPLALEGDEPPAKPAAASASRENRPQREAAPAAPPAAKPDADAAGRATARKVFEAKFREPNPRLPFYITMGALGVFAVGTVVYFWIQLQPPAALVNRNPPAPAGETQLAAADLKPTPSLVPQVPAAAIPGLPAAPPLKPAPQPTAQGRAPAPAAIPVPATPRAPEVPRLQAPRAALPATTEIRSSRPAPQVHPNVTTAYAAYLAGDLASARTDYQHALREEPANRDALLGIAALDVLAGRFENAEAAYLRLLQADPRDSHALGALIALRAGRTDPVAAESRVKSVLAENPGSHVLNFTLGNQLAQQGRWAEAQQEYFRAYTAEPDNADFTYNLAVSLDQLRQPRLALDYYQRAIALAKARGARFDIAGAETRAAQLAR